MHVGHLRSTILGDSICRILEYLGNDVMRINHVGDWGTAFGMLIAYLEFINPDYATNPEKNGNIRDLEEFYKSAKQKFDAEPEFKKKAQLKTVDLQHGDENTRKAWQFICQISRDNFNEIYRRLDIKLKEVGESFYDPIARDLIPQLEEKKLIELDQGAKVFRIPGETNPLMCVKSDGGLGYDTSDLAALKYRLLDLNRDWIIYVVGGEQEIHLRSIFKAGEICGWHKPPQTRLDHMKFGLVTGKDGKKFYYSFCNDFLVQCDVVYKIDFSKWKDASKYFIEFLKESAKIMRSSKSLSNKSQTGNENKKDDSEKAIDKEDSSKKDDPNDPNTLEKMYAKKVDSADLKLYKDFDFGGMRSKSVTTPTYFFKEKDSLYITDDDINNFLEIADYGGSYTKYLSLFKHYSYLSSLISIRKQIKDDKLKKMVVEAKIMICTTN